MMLVRLYRGCGGIKNIDLSFKANKYHPSMNFIVAEPYADETRVTIFTYLH